MSDDYAQSEDSDRLITPSRKKARSNKLKRGGDTPSSSRGSGAKRLKEASKHAYAITETKSPKASLGGSLGMPTGRGHLSPSSSQRSTPKTVRTLARCSLPESTSTPGPSTSAPLPEGVLATGRHTHHGLKWLYQNRTDKNRRRPDHPEYNPRTLYVPHSFLQTETPAMQQWWLFKSDNMDTVLFFKVCSLLKSRAFRLLTPVQTVRVSHFVSVLPGLYQNRRWVSSMSCSIRMQT